MFLMVTRLYFSAKEGGERSVCLSFAFLFLLLAMLVQVVREETLELGLEPGGCASMVEAQFTLFLFLSRLLSLCGLNWPQIHRDPPDAATGALELRFICYYYF